jgi:hypothetical protein
LLEGDPRQQRRQQARGGAIDEGEGGVVAVARIDIEEIDQDVGVDAHKHRS